jgi:hypothetical protein
MAIDFPSPATPGQIFNPGKGVSYIWDGTSWNIVTTASPLTADRRNRVVNPAIQASQEQGNSNGTASGYFMADQWQGNFASSSTINCARSGTIGAPGAIGITASPAETSAAAGEYIQFYQSLEGTVVADLNLGTATSTQMVIAFDIFAIVAGTYWVAFGTYLGTHTWLGSYTIAAGEVGTWVRKVVVIPYGAITAGTWTGDNTGCAGLHFALHCGTTYSAAAGFQAGNFIAGPGQALGLSVAGTVYLRNVGLYADPNNTGLAPPFEVPNYADELSRCQRYWEAQNFYINGYHVAGNQVTALVFHKVWMRTTPTIVYGISSYGNASGIQTIGANDAGVLGVGVTITGTGGCNAQGTAYSSARM